MIRTDFRLPFAVFACKKNVQIFKIYSLIAEYKDKPTEFSINCVDPLNRSALIAAIENENIELIRLLLDAGIQVKDALLHAISEEYVEAVETLLYYEETNHEPGKPYVSSFESFSFINHCMSIASIECFTREFQFSFFFSLNLRWRWRRRWCRHDEM